MSPELLVAIAIGFGFSVLGAFIGVLTVIEFVSQDIANRVAARNKERPDEQRNR